jgi:uncharacterized protein YgiM (DUF1202 family)
MKTLLRALLFVLVLSLAMFASLAQADAKIRFVHVSPGAPAVDVYVAGVLAVQGLEYGEASVYLTVPAGGHTVIVTAEGATTALWEQDITASETTPTTFIAADGTQFFLANDNLTASANGGSRLLLVHAIAGGPGVDVTLAEPVELGGTEQSAGTPLATNMIYSTSVGAFEVPAQTYVVNIAPTGTEDFIVSELPLSLAVSTSYMAIVYGTPAQPQALLLGEMMEATSDSALVRFIHGISGGGAVDVYINDLLVVPGLSAETATAHLALPAGEATVSVRVAGEDTELLGTEVELEAGSAQSVLVAESTGAAVATIISDDVSGALDANTVSLTLTNAIVGADLGGGTITQTSANGLEDVATFDTGTLNFEDSATVTFDPAQGDLTIGVNLGDASGVLTEEVTLYGGTYYNAVVLPGTAFSGPVLRVFPTTLTTTLGSAPNGEQTVDVAVATPAPVAVEATPAPVATTAPIATATPNVITGRILLDPGANLQLRQNPDSDALSLGLAPSGSVLIINGREGAPVALVDGQAPPPEAETWVDPVAELPDLETDLDPTQTWVNVTYNTPDGGQITAWVNAQFLEIRDGRDREVRLRDLDFVGGNIPGRAESTAITPPPITEDTLTARVFNLDPGVQLNIRRTPNVEGEVIGKLDNGTLVIFVGMEESEQWAFIEFATPEGGIISGWVNTLYIEYVYNGREFELEDFKNVVSRTTSQALFEFVSPDLIGEIQGNVSQIAAPTVDPLRDQFVALVQLNQGANLQFRRLPDATSESLNLIPSGTQLIITGANETGEWLQVTFEGEEGWISVGFANITFNGVPATIDQIPVVVPAQ